MPNYARDMGSVYNYYVSNGGSGYASYNLGSYRGQPYTTVSDPFYGTKAATTYYFPYSNVNLGMFYGTSPPF